MASSPIQGINGKLIANRCTTKGGRIMKRFTVGMLAVLFGLVVTFSTVSAAELAKEGSGRTAKINVLKMGEEHV